MSKERITVTLDADMLTEVKQRIGTDRSLSAWLDTAARERLLREDFEAHAAALHAAGWPSAADAEDHAAYLRAVQELSDATR